MSARASVWNLPNGLSLFRVGLIPIILYLLSDPGRVAAAVAGGLFFIACLSDFFDGYFARRSQTTTTLGKYLDPLADKLVVAGVLIMLVGMDRDPKVAAWLVAVIVARDLAVTGLRAIASSEGLTVEAGELGKYKMIFLMFALHGLIIHYTYGPSFFRVDFHAAGMVFLWVSAIVSLWSGIDYHVRVLRVLATRWGEES